MAVEMAVRAGTTSVNGASIYHEVRGSGPAILMIPGAPGDAGWYAPAADLLAREFTVITYDRRGNSRSSAPAGWSATSIQEQADDAAALLRALGLAPATIFGSSGGAIILLDLTARHPDAVRAAIAHDAPVVGALPREEADAIAAEIQAQVAEGMASGGPREGLRRFVDRYSRGAEASDPDLEERILGNAEVLFGIDLLPIVSYVPNVEAIRRSGVPVALLAGEESLRDLPEVAGPSRWLAEQLAADLREVPGGHWAVFDRPREFVEAIRPSLKGEGR